ncbi:MAG: DUF2070 family protein [Thermoprotei archaeon]
MGDNTKVWGRGLLLKSPPTHYSLLFLTVEGFLLGLTKYLTSGTISAFVLIPLIILNPIAARLLTPDKNFTLKRDAYVYLYLNTPLTVILMVDYIQPLQALSSAIFLVALTITSYLLFLVFTTAFKMNNLRGALILAIFISTYYLSNSISPLIIVVDYMLTVLVALIIRESISRIRLDSVTGLELINSFALSWMDKSSYAFDELCKKIGNPAELEISIHELRGPNDVIATIIIPYIHPGPAKTIGSGELPSLIYEALRGYRPLVLHGASDHTLNIASREDTLNTVHLIKQALITNTTPFNPLSRVLYGELNREGIKLSVYELNGNKIGFISKEDNTEDLPPQITSMTSKDLDLVDRHNTLCNQSNAQYTDEEIRVLAAMIGRAVGETKEECSVSSAGYANQHLNALDVGPGGVNVLVIRGQKNIVFVNIDANNLSCRFNLVIENTVKSLGYDLCEVTTTDNHWNSGSTRREPGYYTGGSLSAKELVDTVIKCVKEAERNASKPLYRKTRVTLKVNVFGNSLEKMYDALNSGRKLLFIGASICIVAPLILSLI